MTICKCLLDNEKSGNYVEDPYNYSNAKMKAISKGASR